MDEQTLKLFAEVGPHAKEALDSYILLQWFKFIIETGLITLVIFGGIVFLIFLVRKN